SKQAVKQYLFEHVRIPARKFEYMLRVWAEKPIWNLTEEYQAGRIPKVFCESDDPDRLVPLVTSVDAFMIAVTGDPLRTNAYVFAHNGRLGYPVAKSIDLPANWNF
ncbi:MAG: UGSC family (seleno)protein, partial [Alcaligenaceae bacterium]